MLEQPKRYRGIEVTVFEWKRSCVRPREGEVGKLQTRTGIVYIYSVEQQSSPGDMREKVFPATAAKLRRAATKFVGAGSGTRSNAKSAAADQTARPPSDFPRRRLVHGGGKYANSGPTGKAYAGREGRVNAGFPPASGHAGPTSTGH